MTVTPVLPDLYQLVIPTPFPVGPVNIYLAAGPAAPLTLIDTGPRTEQARSALESGFATLGCRPSDVGRVIVTHAHADHYGLAGDIVQVAGASVYSHPNNRSMLEDHAVERERQRAFYADLLLEAGMPPDVQATLAHVFRGFRDFETALSSVVALDEGDQLALAGQQWQVLFLPGHSGGLICLYQPDTRIFLSNDHLLRDISSNPLFEPPPSGQTRRRRSLADYIRSLERTAAIDIAVAWPGHGEPITDHRALIQGRLAFHRRRADRILDVLRDGAHTVYGLSQAIFGALSALDCFLAASEILAHLEWLEDQGAVASQRRDDLVLWLKT